MDIYDRIDAVRVYKSLKQIEFSELVGVSQSTISDVKKKKSKPNSDLLTGIANNIREVDIHWVLTGEGSMKRDDDSHFLNAGEINLSHLSEVVEIVETALQEVDAKPSPKKRGELVAAAYDFYSIEEVASKPGALLRLVKTAAQD